MEIFSWKDFPQKPKKYFIGIKILPRFKKPSVTAAMYKKSTKVYLILLHFIFINVHINGLNKYGWIKEKINICQKILA